MNQEYYEATAIITDKGELKPVALIAFRQAMRRFAPGQVTIRVEVEKHKRSNALNRFWWGTVVKLFAEHCGEYPEDMHEILKLQLLPKTVEYLDAETGESKTAVIGRSTRNLTNHEFKDLIFRAQHLGSNLGIYIPDPGEVAA